MTEPAQLLPLLPLLIPFVGAWCVACLPEPWVGGLERRWAHNFVMLLMLGAVLLTGRSSALALTPAAAPVPLAYGEVLRLDWDAQARMLATTLLAAKLLVGLALMREPLGKLESFALLQLLTATGGILAAGNLFTLCLVWGLSDLALLCLVVIQGPAENNRRAVWNAWAGLMATVALVTAAVLVAGARGESSWAALTLRRAPVALLMFASVVRMGVAPLSGSLRAHWQTYLATLWAGASLWLRLAATHPAVLSDWSGWGVAGAALLILTGLLAALAPNLDAALPYMVLNGLTLAVLAPIIAPEAGYAVAVLCLLALLLAMALWCVADRLHPALLPRWWARLPAGVSLGSLMGAPLTLGAIAHWSFLRLCWSADQRALVCWGSLSFMLVAVPAWRQLTLGVVSSLAPQAPRRWWHWCALGCAALLASALVVTGVAPGLVARAWGGQTPLNQTEAIAHPLSGPHQVVGVLLYTALLGPILGGRGLQQLLAAAPAAATRALHLLRGLLVFDWLVLLIEELLTRIQVLAERMLVAIEEPFSLGWSLIWGLSLVFFMIEGRI